MPNLNILVTISGDYKLSENSCCFDEITHGIYPCSAGSYNPYMSLNLEYTSRRTAEEPKKIRYGTSLNKSKKMHGALIKTFDNREIHIIAGYDTGSLKEEFVSDLFRNGIELNHDYVSIDVNKNKKFVFFPEKTEILLFDDKKEFTGKVKGMFSKEEFEEFNSFGNKMEIAQKFFDNFYSYEGTAIDRLKSFKSFKETYLTDKDFVKFFIDTIDSVEEKEKTEKRKLNKTHSDIRDYFRRFI